MSGPPPHTGYGFPGFSNLHKDIYPSITASLTPALRQSEKVVLITGAGRGLGRAIALQYAHASVGAIILCARTGSEIDEVEQSIQKVNSDIRVHKHQIDVTDNSAVAALAEDVKSKEGRLDILVNNAGASPAWTNITESDPVSWWSCLEVNVKGPFLFLHAFLPLLTATAGREKTTVNVINMSSIGAHTVNPTSSAYSISKLAVLRMTEFVNVEYKDKGVIAVGLHPGAVLTEMSSKVEILQPLLNDKPDLCGGFVVWLTADSRAWLAGRYVSATWDVDVLEGMKDDIVAGNKLKVFMAV